jgi:putative toxin-antitoxin system antitoxin component (TIGR02293 family)
MAGDEERFDPDTAIFAKAVEIFGSKEEAELWLRRPAMGLDGQRPIDLLKSPEGKQLVEEFLARLEHGVYQ